VARKESNLGCLETRFELKTSRNGIRHDDCIQNRITALSRQLPFYWWGSHQLFLSDKLLGVPNILGGFTKAPFDTIGDTLRGTKGIMLDMYRQPDKLLQAMEAITPIMINMGVAAAQQTGNPLIFIPLHKGADGFLSDEQFKKFYWPTLRKVILGLIDAGCVPFPAAEGGYNSRLEVIKDIPKGKTVWMFDQTDIVKAKKIVGDTLCIFGNVPSAMLELGTPQEVKDYAKKLIDTVGTGGGFIMANGAFFDQAKPENVKALIDFTREYGVYS
jgi:uroporphyrinogen-III decarboxylase